MSVAVTQKNISCASEKEEGKKKEKEEREKKEKREKHSSGQAPRSCIHESGMEPRSLRQKESAREGLPRVQTEPDHFSYKDGGSKQHPACSFSVL